MAITRNLKLGLAAAIIAIATLVLSFGSSELEDLVVDVVIASFIPVVWILTLKKTADWVGLTLPILIFVALLWWLASTV